MICIYKITCNINKKVYIGQTTNWNKRKREHRNSLNRNQHFNKNLQNSWNKYGEQYFSFEILEECAEDELDSKEIFWNAYYGYPDNNKVFNFESGGHKNKHLNEETKSKISAFNKGKVISEKHRKILSERKTGKNNHFYGKIYTPAERKVQSERMKMVKIKKSSIDAIIKSNILRQTPILQFDLNGIFIKEYSGINNAAKETKSQSSLIHKCCNGLRIKHNGFIWKYKKSI